MGRRGKPTQAELREQAKENFMSDTKSRFEDLVAEYFLAQGYVLLANDVPESQLDIAEPIKPQVQEFYKAQRMVEEGGNLTGKRKEQMLEHIFSIEESISKLNGKHPILNLYKKHSTYSGWGSLLIGVSALILLIGLFWNPLLFAFPATAGLAFYLLHNASLAKANIKQQAIQVISEI